MDRKRSLVGFGLLLGAMAFAMSANAAGDASSLRIDPSAARLKLDLGSPISLECKNPGTHQDVAKSPSLKNTAGATLKKGTTVYWRATDGDAGSMKLEADLAPGASVQALGKPGNGYQCTSHFLAKPDLTIRKAKFATQSSATIEVQNLDAWMDAKPSVVRVEVVSCSGPVLAAVDTTMPVSKGEVRAISVPFSAPSGNRYLRVRADATSVLSESNEANNMWNDMDSCIH